MIAGFDYNSYRGEELTHDGELIGTLAPVYHAHSRACHHAYPSNENIWPKWPPDWFTD